MKLKKIPYYLYLLLFTAGASLIIGFLSFVGMYTLFPIVLLATAAFILSVGYEGEIYLQNLKGAYEKLVKPDYIKRYLAKEFLRDNFPDTSKPDCPQFFKDYDIQLKQLHEFQHKRLKKADRQRKQALEDSLNDLEKMFAHALFSSKKMTNKNPLENDTTKFYQAKLREWLNHEDNRQKIADLKKKANKRSNIDLALKLGSVVAGIFMAVGITFVLVDAFAVLPLLATISVAALPFIIVPMAIISGVAFTFLIYNSATEWLKEDVVSKWLGKINKSFEQGRYLRGLGITISAVALGGLAVLLSLFTLGTWVTIIKNGRPLFAWMSKIPSVLMLVILPSLLGAAQFVFNLENIQTSLELLLNATKIKLSKIGHTIVEGFKQTVKNENIFQLLNPFRLLLKVTIVPIRLVLFVFHLISIGVTADRVPGVPSPLTALIGIICEGFEDLHYFLGDLLHSDKHGHSKDAAKAAHEHKHKQDASQKEKHPHNHGSKKLLKERFAGGHGHDHSADLPTKVLKFIFLPVYRFAAVWDWGFSNLHTTKLSWAEACDKHPDNRLTAFLSWGRSQLFSAELFKAEKLSWAEARDKQFGLPKKEKKLLTLQTKGELSPYCQVARIAYQIDSHSQKLLASTVIGKKTIRKQVEEIKRVKHDLLHMKNPTEESIRNRIVEEIGNEAYNKHRLWKNRPGDTPVKKLVGELYTGKALAR
ncbi:MAG: hypothetical protein WC785_00370 [Tatlockia sp.]|jgi:hypothetical protein